MEEKRSACRIFCWKTGRKGTTRNTKVDDIKMDLVQDMDGLDLSTLG
jgi:hypothetical protein